MELITQKQKERMPALFIGHGSPMNIVLDNSFTRSLRSLGKTLPLPEAILVISAHWLIHGSRITCEENPRQIYDFYGFPDELYRVQYSCKGCPELAREIGKTVKKVKIVCDDGWGLDHASWAVLKHIYPDAGIPVIEMSLDIMKPARYHYELGAALGFLRDRGVLVIGSGNIVHNLRMMTYDMNAAAFSWAEKFDSKVATYLTGKQHDRLIDYHLLGEAAQLSIPTSDHYLPMLYVVAMQEEGDQITFIHESIQHGSVSMRCFRIG